MSDSTKTADMEACAAAWLATREHYDAIGIEPSGHMLFMDAFNAGLAAARHPA